MPAGTGLLAERGKTPRFSTPLLATLRSALGKATSVASAGGDVDDVSLDIEAVEAAVSANLVMAPASYMCEFGFT